MASALALDGLMRARGKSNPAPDDDDVDEASDESFPASDPPAYTPTHAGSPDHRRDRSKEGGG